MLRRPGLHNSKVPDVIRQPEGYGIKVRVNDPLANSAEARREYDFELHGRVATKVAVGRCVVDVKAIFPLQEFEGMETWRL